MLKRIVILVLLVATFSWPGFGQRNNRDNDKLAIHYFEQKEYAKANDLFEELFDHNPDAWYNYYYRSLVGAKDYSKAEKITRRLLKHNKGNVFFYVYLGKLYGLQNDPKKEKEYYDKAVKDLIPVQPHIDNLAATFKDEKLYDYAIEVYNRGRKQSPEYPYFYERADLYKLKNDLASMINEYLDAVEFRESELETVQRQLQNSLGYDDEQGGMRNPLLKQELQRRIQKHPDKIVLSEFLIFILKQQNDFAGAFAQSKALDKRLREDGQRIYDLAKICKSNANWETARRCYDYLLEKGPASVYYDAATVDGLQVDFMSVTQKSQPQTEELSALEQKLQKAQQKYRETPMYGQILKDLSVLKAFYLNKTEDAVGMLNEYIDRAGVDPVVKADFKLLLADIYLIKGEIWEASLLYSQVEKAFKYEAIGNEAKYRNARLSFYAGDFAWAKAQADVLKGSTSKLIANDALDLSLIITDAIGVDTNDIPLKLFASAELMMLQHRYDDALNRLDSINLLFNTHTLGDDIFFKKAQIYEKLGQPEQVEEMYKNVLQYYPGDLYGDDSQFRLAELYDRTLKDREKARQAYQDLLTNYPGSIFTVEARKRYRILRGDNLNN